MLKVTPERSDASCMDPRDDATDWDFDDGLLGPWGRDRDVAADGDVEVDDEPIRKGGGPPGRSAFLPGGRLRRLNRDRVRSKDRAPVAEPVLSAFRPATEEPAFRPISEWLEEPATTGAEPTTDPGPGGWDPFAEPFFGEAPDPADVAAEPVPQPTERARTSNSSSRDRAFPGGRAKLPRLNTSNEGPELDFVSTAFIPGQETGEDDAPRTGFHGYNTYESLFADATIAEPLTRPTDGDAYAVLGVDPDADWKDIVRAHRRLVKANHPDHLVDAPASERHAAEERLRQINLAYREVKDDRRERGESSDGDGPDLED
jgi:hypothetical protein